MKKIAKLTTINITRIAVLSALAFILDFLSFPILPYAPFLKIDFGDVPVFTAGFAMGPIFGIVVSLVKNLLQMPFSNTGFVGEFSNFIQGAVFVIVSCAIYKKHKGILSAVIAMVAAILSVTAVGMLTNYFIMLPLYGIPKNTILPMIFTAILPFNLIKFSLQSVAVMLLYKHIARPLLKQDVKLKMNEVAKNDKPENDK